MLGTIDNNETWLRLRNDLVTKGGFSADILTGEAPQGGYMVSVPGHELKVHSTAYSSMEWPWLIRRYAGTQQQRVAELLADVSVYIGGWQDGEWLYLDVSLKANDLGAAIYWAARWQQLAIYDVEAGESVYLEGLRGVPAQAFRDWYLGKLAQYGEARLVHVSNLAEIHYFGAPVFDAYARVRTLHNTL